MKLKMKAKIEIEITMIMNSIYYFLSFQSGNLHSAFRVIPSAGGSGASAVGSLSVNSETVKKSPFCMMRLQTYDLYMHNDCFTHGHTQWFYFSVKNVLVGQSIVFNIKNFTKSDSLFTEGKYFLSYFLLFFSFLFCVCVMDFLLY
jgi:Cytosolic carboxypeptidase N-terminal domain